MSLGTSNRDGGKTSESGHLRALAKMVNGDVLEGLNVSQRSAGANMSVDVAVGDALVRRSDGSYAHPVFNDAVYNQAITAADGSNPRRDLIVIYVDYGQAPSTAVSNNTNGVVKIKVVTGTPAGSPVDPNGTAIQSSVGSGNPYSILARVRVPAGQTSITNSLIDDLRTLITNKPTSVDTASIIDSSVTKSKVAASAIDSSKVDFSSTGKVWWEELGRTTLTSAGDSIDVSFTAKKYLQIIVNFGATGGTAENALRFNNDSGNNYSYRLSTNGGADSTFTSQNRAQLAGEFAYTFAGAILNVINTATAEKNITGQRFGNFTGTPGAATSAPDRAETLIKWANSSTQINRVTVVNTTGTGDFAIGSSIVILGHD